MRTVFFALLWLCETWHPTLLQLQRMESWGARLLARVSHCRRDSTEDIADFWRRMHRTGHFLLHAFGGPLCYRFRVSLHRFAGHTALSIHSTMIEALRTRCLAWWRYQQARGLCKHPRRFHAWRWESQVVDFFGEAESADTLFDVGWMFLAQDREAWKATEHDFAASE
jgi:hypothetical protein